MVLSALREKNLAKNLVENDKKFSVEPCQVRERERKVWKSRWTSQIWVFLKNLIHDVRLIEKQVRSIKPDRGSLKFFIRISIDRKSDWINRKSGKKHLFRKITWFFENIPQSIEYKKSKCMSMRWNVFPKHKF